MKRKIGVGLLIFFGAALAIFIIIAQVRRTYMLRQLDQLEHEAFLQCEIPDEMRYPVEDLEEIYLESLALAEEGQYIEKESFSKAIKETPLFDKLTNHFINQLETELGAKVNNDDLKIYRIINIDEKGRTEVALYQFKNGTMDFTYKFYSDGSIDKFIVNLVEADVRNGVAIYNANNAVLYIAYKDWKAKFWASESNKTTATQLDMEHYYSFVERLNNGKLPSNKLITSEGIQKYSK